MPNDGRHPWLAEVEIDGLYFGKPGRFSHWRAVLAEIVGAPVDYVSRRRPFHSPTTSLHPPLTLEFIEAQVTAPGWAESLPSKFRHGIWETTPEEPLLVVILATVPGATFYARHANAIAQRLDEIDELVHYVGQGSVTGLHEHARQCFAEQAITGKDMSMSGGYEPGGWWTPDLDE